jgi:hypothetical protein
VAVNDARRAESESVNNEFFVSQAGNNSEQPTLFGISNKPKLVVRSASLPLLNLSTLYTRNPVRARFPKQGL